MVSSRLALTLALALTAFALGGINPAAATSTTTCSYTIAEPCVFPVRAGQTVTVTASDAASENVPIQFCDEEFTECTTGCGTVVIRADTDGNIYVGDAIAALDAGLSCIGTAGEASVTYS